ncbi:MAG: cyclic lactone autoinducer peptide [Ruminococcus sp.]
MKTTKKTITGKVLSAAQKMTERELTKSANTASCIFMHQPKAPQALSKLRKF